MIAGIKIPRNFSLYLWNFVTWVIVSAIATGALWLAIMIMDYLSTLLAAKRPAPDVGGSEAQVGRGDRLHA